MNRSVLIVDDEPLIRELLVTELQACGFRVLEAESGSTALVLLERESIDLVISDVRMPDGDGFSLLKAVQSPAFSVALESSQKASAMRPAFFMMTGILDLEAGGFQKLGARALIPKPFLLDDVIRLVREFFQAEKRTEAALPQGPRTP